MKKKIELRDCITENNYIKLSPELLETYNKITELLSDKKGLKEVAHDYGYDLSKEYYYDRKLRTWIISVDFMKQILILNINICQALKLYKLLCKI